MAATGKRAPVAGALDIETLIAGATLREVTVPLCLAGHLLAEYQELERKLSDAAAMMSDSLAGSPRVPIARRMEELRQEMAAQTVDLRFRAVTPKAWSDLIAEHPGGPDQLFNPDTLPAAVVAACAVEPTMTVEQFGRLADKLTHGQQELIINALWDINTRAVSSVPFSLLASATAASPTGES
ncbi:hypothetical protein [Streptomyces sp. CB03911]|uniref:hypothetical protein n=1 Tax=Streptomyces sp. CB03911 TaxID=1804758 RepID=UPI00093A43FE|nr:hypothetical protein [Streptomyces sp. CB03911]OKI22202.1 hypothetical protein A6A07_34575 [Streptomyces sp. CB03911]